MAKYIELNSDKTPKTGFDTFYNSTENLENAGLILDPKTVIVDFDKNPEIAEEILKEIKTKAIKTTRGYHLYFKVPKNLKIVNKSHVTTVLGNKVDYKTGQGGKKAYGIVKLNGKDRYVLNGTIKSLPELPKILYPTNSSTDFCELKEGSRNDSLFKHLLSCGKYFDNEDELVSIAIRINNIIPQSLKKNELENIVNSVISKLKNNDDLFDNSGKKPKLDMFKFTEFIRTKFKVITYNKRLYFKDGYNYTSDNMVLLNRVRKLGFKLKKTQDNELIHQLEKTAEIIDFEGKDLPITLNNGYQIYNGVISLTQGLFTPFNLDVAYDKNVYDKDVDEFINWLVCNDQEMRQLIEEIIGHIIMTSSFPQHSFFFVGSNGKNGKSTFFEMLSNFCGSLSENLALEEMNKIENLAVLKDKLLNCGDDIDDTHILSSRTFKNLVAGNNIMVRELYSNPKPFKNKATLLFSCNEMPNFKDKSGGIERRVRIIPCDNIVKKVDLSIDSKLSTPNAKSYLLNLALKGMNSIINNGGIMINPKRSILETEEYIKESDTVKLFIEYCKESDISLEQPTSKIYMLYSTFCDTEGQKPYSKSKLSRRLNNSGYKSIPQNIQGKSIRCYVKE